MALELLHPLSLIYPTLLCVFRFRQTSHLPLKCCWSICSVLGQRNPQYNSLVHAESAAPAAAAHVICKLHLKPVIRGRNLAQSRSRQSLSSLPGSLPSPAGACPCLQGLSLHLSGVAVHIHQGQKGGPVVCEQIPSSHWAGGHAANSRAGLVLIRWQKEPRHRVLCV